MTIINRVVGDLLLGVMYVTYITYMCFIYICMYVCMYKF